MTRIYGCPIFLENSFVENVALAIDEDCISAIIPMQDITSSEDDIILKGGFLAPGFIDLQVNGGGGTLLNDKPTVEGVRTIAHAHRQFGTTALLPTLISDTPSVIRQAINAVDAAIENGVPGVIGIHIEGPFLNPEKKGVHDVSKFLSLNSEMIDLFSSLKRGKTLVTLAPEKLKPGQISELVQRGIIVAAGHTNATYETIGTALQEGLSGFTHLYNAMSQLHSRAPGVVGAALDADHTWSGIIADTYHVHDAALRIAIKCKPTDKTVLVTDAMPSVGAPKHMRNFDLFGKKVTETDGKLTIEAGNLAGSALDMMTAVKNTVTQIGIPLDNAITMATTAPATAIKIENKMGSISVGKKANLVHFSNEFSVIRTWIDGVTA